MAPPLSEPIHRQLRAPPPLDLCVSRDSLSSPLPSLLISLNSRLLGSSTMAKRPRSDAHVASTPTDTSLAFIPPLPAPAARQQHVSLPSHRRPAPHLAPPPFPPHLALARVHALTRASHPHPHSRRRTRLLARQQRLSARLTANSLRPPPPPRPPSPPRRPRPPPRPLTQSRPRRRPRRTRRTRTRPRLLCPSSSRPQGYASSPRLAPSFAHLPSIPAHALSPSNSPHRRPLGPSLSRLLWTRHSPASCATTLTRRRLPLPLPRRRLPPLTPRGR